MEYATFEDSSQGAVGDYQVYLPPCYAADTSQRYPVVYLLHGAGHDDAYWLEVGIVGAADDAIEHGKAAPMIFVMPDGGETFRPGRDGVSFEKFLTDELVPKIDASYRTAATRDGRAVGGISMGGGVALTIAAQAPTLFTAVGGHSPAVNDPAAVATALTQGGQRVWLDVGADDFLRSGTVELANQLDAMGADSRLEIPEGEHVESYWQSHLAEYLNFYNDSFTTTG